MQPPICRERTIVCAPWGALPGPGEITDGLAGQHEPGAGRYPGHAARDTAPPGGRRLSTGQRLLGEGGAGSENNTACDGLAAFFPVE